MKHWRSYKNKAIKFVEALGMKTWEPPTMVFPDFSWDGEYLDVRRNATDIIHDGAHWIVAPAYRKNIPEFGLGASPDLTKKSDEANKLKKITSATAQKEEEMASVLGILIERKFGMPWTLTAEDHSWDHAGEINIRSMTFKSFKEATRKPFTKLIERGLIDELGNPTLEVL